MKPMTDAEVDRILANADPEDVRGAASLLTGWTPEEIRRFADTGEEPAEPEPAAVEREGE